MKRPLKILSIFLIVTVVLKMSSFTMAPPPEDNHENLFHQNYAVYSLSIPKDLHFSNEDIPIYMNDISERLDREFLVNTYWQSQGILLIKRANKFFPIIEPILKKNKIPDDFKYLAVAESGLTNTVSPSGAHGFWQILKKTGQEYDLEINDYIDERYNLEKSTQVACDYLNNAFKEFKNWTLAAAAYNMGISGIRNQLEKQKVNNYYDLHLNKETSRYLFRIIALKYILSDSKNYGFNLRDSDLYTMPSITKVTVDSTINSLVDFAIKNKVQYKTLKIYNPWLKTNYMPNPNKKSYVINLPITNNLKEK